MKTLFLSIVTLLVFTQIGLAQNATYLKYRVLEGKNDKMTDLGYVEFWNDDQIFQMKKSYGKTPGPSKAFDLKKGIVIFDFENIHNYFVEELKLMYPVNCEPKSTGETETINGYNCKKYTITTKFLSYTFTSYLWITQDISSNESNTQYMMACLTGNTAMCTFKGTLVKMEFYKGKEKAQYVLEKYSVKPEDAKAYTYPWKRNEDYRGILPNDNIDYGGAFIMYTKETFPAYKNRLKELLIKVTGLEKPEYTLRNPSMIWQ